MKKLVRLCGRTRHKNKINITTNAHEFKNKFYVTLNDRKSRMPHIRGIKGEAVVVYCEPLITKKMGYHRLS